jgi:hypothetical protein
VPNIEADPLFQAYGLNDTKITKQLYEVLLPQVDSQIFKAMQHLQDRLTNWMSNWGYPLPSYADSSCLNYFNYLKRASLTATSQY